MMIPKISHERAFLTQMKKGILFLAIFSFAMNLLILSGPIFMLQVYDRVLASGSIPTLIVLFGLLAFSYVIMGILDHYRARILTRMGGYIQESNDDHLFLASMRIQTERRDEARSVVPFKEMSLLQSLFSSPVIGTLFDLPFSLIFFALMFFFHPWMGWFSVGSAALLIAIAIVNQRMTASLQSQSGRESQNADQQAEIYRKNHESIIGLGMERNVLLRWKEKRIDALKTQMHVSDISGAMAVTTKTIRLFVQSAVLALGALLVLMGEMTAGAMIAGSILLGRALAPIEQSVGQWSLIQKSLMAWKDIKRLLDIPVKRPVKSRLPRPEARLEVQDMYFAPAGEPLPILQAISFSAKEGDAIAVVGPSASGKTSLAKVLSGVWRASRGKVLLGGSDYLHFSEEDLGSYIGYLSQSVDFFPGTIAENIARLALKFDIEDVISAAKEAQVHDLILALPKGYDTEISEFGYQLSGGQKQRIGLARAFYGNPIVLVLDEPNASLDDQGSAALNEAISVARRSGKITFVMSHRPSVLTECTKILMLESGRMKIFGNVKDVVGQKPVQVTTGSSKMTPDRAADRLSRISSVPQEHKRSSPPGETATFSSRRTRLILKNPILKSEPK